jgi:hypothetical protein
MDKQRLRAGWETLGAAVAEELADWRAAHPRATLAEIEQVVLGAMERLQARYLTDLVQASAAADLGAARPEERPRCPECRGPLEPRGQQEREGLSPRQTAAVRLRRSYGVCPTCAVGLFPPGR